MNLLVKDILNIDVLKNATFIAGKNGASNIVKSVSIIEIPSATAWYKGGELQASALYSIADDLNSQLQLIRDLSKYGCAGLILCHVGVWIKEVPQALIDLANQLAFPVIVVPKELAYADIIAPIMAELLENENKKLEFSLTVNDKMTDAILLGKDYQYLLEILGQLIDHPSILFDTNNEQIASYKADLSKGNMVILGEYIKENRDYFLRNKRNVILHSILNDDIALFSPIISGDTYYGILVIFHASSLEPLDTVAIDQTKNALALITMKKMRFNDIKDEMRKEFVHDLIEWNFKDEDTAIERAKNLGWNIKHYKQVMVVDIDKFLDIQKNKSENELLEMKQELFIKVKEVVRKENYNNDLFRYSDKVIILMFSDQPASLDVKRPITLGENIITMIGQQMGLNVSVGVGRSYESISDLSTSYEEGFKALEIGKKIWGNQSCILYKNLGIYEELYDLANNPKVHQWIDDMFLDVKNYDDENHTNMLETLKCLLEQDENTAAVANALFVHKNTVLYRKKKITEIMSFNPFTEEFKFRFRLAALLEKLK